MKWFKNIFETRSNAAIDEIPTLEKLHQEIEQHQCEVNACLDEDDIEKAEALYQHAIAKYNILVQTLTVKNQIEGYNIKQKAQILQDPNQFFYGCI